MISLFTDWLFNRTTAVSLRVVLEPGECKVNTSICRDLTEEEIKDTVRALETAIPIVLREIHLVREGLPK